MSASFDEFVPADYAPRAKMDGIVLSDALVRAAESAKERGVSLVVFASLTCPDCAAVLPYVGLLAKLGMKVELGEKDAEAEEFLQRRLGTGRVPTVLAKDAAGNWMDGVLIERPLAVHMAAAKAESKRDAAVAIGRFRSGGAGADIEDDLICVLEGKKREILPFLR
ncbi:MAG: thioredoxin family protein [Synergistaceae bacterium]|jgi:hypothetical protein|nr:thioredoxin family protein [Synergistaceae bacterium]